MKRHLLSETEQQRLKESQLSRCGNPHLADVVERNIRVIMEMRREREQRKGVQERVADAVTTFSGSMAFVYLHLAWFGLWVVLNVGWMGLKPFDPFPFGLLTMAVSLEAIFLSTFVLISQNRMSIGADQRADLDLQINLLAEHEITRILTVVDAIAGRLGLPVGTDAERGQLEQDVSADEVVREMAVREREAN